MNSLMAWLSLLVAIGAAILASLSWWTARKILMRQTLADLLKEYRSPQMGLAIERLWYFYKNKCNGDKEELIEQYKHKYGEIINQDRREKLSTEKIRDTLHFHRRLVSQFYQHLAILRFKRILPKDIVYKIWPKDALEIIEKILRPIETQAIPEAMGKQKVTVEEATESIKLMCRLYEESKHS